MASATSFVGTPATLRAPAATRRARARVASVTRADGSAQASTCVVTPATVAQRSGSASVKGTVRKQNEDRFASYVRTPALPPVSPPPRAPRRRPLTTRRSILPDRRSTDDPRARPVFPRLTRSASSPLPRQVNPNAAPGSPYAIYSVFDGHGGFAVSEWLKENLAKLIVEEWPKADFCLEALSRACLKADYDLIQPPEGFFAAFGERGVGGSKCGSTAVVSALFEEGGSTKLCTANVGDARILLVRDGKAVQLSVDHVPDDENERRRIDRGNPNLRKSLVTFTEGSWRVGGVLALSRAFGDAFLKESGRFEGFGERNADYGSGFGLNAEPDCYIEQLTEKDTWVMMSSDGLFANDERGGGGGFENQEIADFLLAASPDATPESLAKELCSMAVSKGSTDDVTVTLMKL